MIQYNDKQKEQLHTLAMFYIRKNDAESIAMFKKMIDSNAIDFTKNNNQLITEACVHDSVKFLELIDQTGFNILEDIERDLNVSIVQKSFDCFDYFLTKDIDFSKFDQTNTAKLAIQYRSLDMLKAMVDKGLDIQTEASDLLCFATYYIEKDIVKYILETTNADINFANSYVLLSFCKLGDVEFMKYLVSKGIDTTVFGDSALRTAAKYGNLDLVKYFIENKISCSSKESIEMALGQAEENHQTHVYEYLKTCL